MFFLKKLLTQISLPPTSLFLMILIGLWLMRAGDNRWRNRGFFLAIFSVMSLFLLNTPLVSWALVKPLESYPPISQSGLNQAQAIVILGGGTYYGAPEYGGDTISSASLQRIRYGARLSRQSGLPILVTGGAPFGGRPEAVLMAETLEREFAVTVRWIEDKSRNTAENAVLSAAQLKLEGVTHIILLSHSRHLPRSIPLFQKEGLIVIPAPTAFSTYPPSLLANLLPGGLGRSTSAFHEYFGMFFNFLSQSWEN
jgi:uncharacterized SAM-binding protein YcdF (DUF218 family)